MDDERVKEGYYCLAIAIIKGCTPEKARALFDNRAHWITQDIILEMREMHRYYSITKLAEIYGIDRSQVVQYLRKTKQQNMAQTSCNP
jgi:hypothetical protein